MNKCKSQALYLYEQFYLFFKYISSHLLSALIILAGVLLTFGTYAFATDYYIDSEVVINIPGTNYNWLEIGRYGLVFVRKLLGTDWYNPYYTGLLLLLFLWLTAMTLAYISGRFFPKLPVSVTTLGSLLFVTYPTFSEQYYFHYQSAEIAFGLWLSMIAAGMFFAFVHSRRIVCFILSLLIYVLTFSIYQSFVPLALCCYLGIFLSFILAKETDTKLIKRSIAGSILHFLIAFGISQAIGRIFFTNSDYLGDQIIWTHAASFWEAFKAVASTCLRMFIGQGLFYTIILPIAVVSAAVVLLPYLLVRKKPEDSPAFHRIVLAVLSVIGITVTPFILTMLMGQSTAARTQFTYPLAALFLLYFSVPTLLQSKLAFRFTKHIFPAFLLLLTLSQIYTVRLIWNAHSYVAEHDRKLSTQIMEELYNSPVICDGVGTILWGNIQPESPYEDALEYTPSTMFFSVFNLEHDMAPICYFSSIRVLGYMESMGHIFPLPTYSNQFVAEYHMSREGLAIYPENGCTLGTPEAFVLNLGSSSE